MVKKLAKPGLSILREMSPLEAHTVHMLLGLSGEIGEIVDACKKQIIYRKPIDRENVVEELGDVEFYLEGMRQGLGITREEVIAHNIAKLAVRYEGFNYSNEAAQARADKVLEAKTASATGA